MDHGALDSTLISANHSSQSDGDQLQINHGAPDKGEPPHLVTPGHGDEGRVFIRWTSGPGRSAPPAASCTTVLWSTDEG